jgi:transcriptional regulator with XRE-family HTH domain
MSNERRSTAVDAYVGRRLKQRREDLNMSQERLAEMLGISFQQVQKYERGLNRVGASRLFQLCGIMSDRPSSSTGCHLHQFPVWLKRHPSLTHCRLLHYWQRPVLLSFWQITLG